MLKYTKIATSYCAMSNTAWQVLYQPLLCLSSFTRLMCDNYFITVIWKVKYFKIKHFEIVFILETLSISKILLLFLLQKSLFSMSFKFHSVREQANATPLLIPLFYHFITLLSPTWFYYLLSHFTPMFHVYNLRKRLKTRGFLNF